MHEAADLPFEVSSPATRACAGQLRECSVERSLITEACLKGNFKKRFIGVQEEMLRASDPLRDHPSMYRLTETGLE